MSLVDSEIQKFMRLCVLIKRGKKKKIKIYYLPAQSFWVFPISDAPPWESLALY